MTDKSSLTITLLTHERELTRPTNTGKLALSDPCFAAHNVCVEQVIWSRVAANSALVRALNNGEAGLLYPHGEGDNLSTISECTHWVVLDATWQESHKMWKQSPYLKTARWHDIAVSSPSIYRLRRNQREQGLCTAECIEYLLTETQHTALAEHLKCRLLGFIEDKKAGRTSD